MVVEAGSTRNWHVLGVPGVRVVQNWCEEPVEEHEAEGDVGLGPPGGGKRGPDVCNLGPIEGDERHAHAVLVSEHLVDGDIVRDNPADPGEVAEGLENVAREEVPKEPAQEAVVEEPLSGDTAARTHASVLLSVQGVE